MRLDITGVLDWGEVDPRMYRKEDGTLEDDAMYEHGYMRIYQPSGFTPDDVIPRIFGSNSSKIILVNFEEYRGTNNVD